MQTTLLSFLGQKEIYPTIIYLHNNYDVQYITNIPFESVYIGKIKWNYSKNDLHIYIHQKLTNNESYTFNSNYTTKNISLLKSQLQKSIRRMNTDLSINIAYQMINLDFNEFIRRLLIITLEDVILNQYFPILTWMMVAYSTKKWHPTNYDINWILNYINYLCNIPYREKYSKINDISQPYDHNNPLYNSLIFSIELRKSYGGMKGDIKFLNWFVKEWNTKFRSTSTSEYTNSLMLLKKKMEIRDILDKNMILIKPIDMLLEGCDFHNYPTIIPRIHSKYNEFTQEEIKKTIWEYSSKTNHRDYINSNIKDIPNIDYNNIWNKIKKLKNELSKKYLIQCTL